METVYDFIWRAVGTVAIWRVRSSSAAHTPVARQLMRRSRSIREAHERR